MGVAPRRRHTARDRATRSARSHNRLLLIGLGVLVLIGVGAWIANRYASKDLPTWEAHAQTARSLNDRIAELARRRPADPDAPDADPWLDEMQAVLDQFVEIGRSGAVGDREGFDALKRELGRTRTRITEALSGEAWAAIREAALGHVPAWRAGP